MTKEELKVLVEELRVKAVEEDNANLQKISEWIQSYSRFPIRVCGSIRDTKSISLVVEFIKPDGKSDFGSDFHIYYYGEGYSAYHKPGIEISNGSIGSYSKEDLFQLERVKVIYNIWNNIEEFENLFKSISCPIGTVFQEKYDELEKIEYNERQEEYRAKREAVEKQFEVGVKFQTSRGYKYKIEKITPKRVYYSEYNSYYDKYLNYDKFFEKSSLIDMFLWSNEPMKFESEVKQNDTTII